MLLVLLYKIFWMNLYENKIEEIFEIGKIFRIDAKLWLVFKYSDAYLLKVPGFYHPVINNMDMPCRMDECICMTLMENHNYAHNFIQLPTILFFEFNYLLKKYWIFNLYKLSYKMVYALRTTLYTLKNGREKYTQNSLCICISLYNRVPSDIKNLPNRIFKHKTVRLVEE